MLPLRHVCAKFCLPVFVFGSLPGFAQTSQVRLPRALDASPRAVLAHSRTPRVRAAEDLGALAPETRVSGVTLVFRRSATQEAELQQLLSGLQNSSSPMYHQWLTPSTFAARFGVADADILTAGDWLTAHGLHVDNIASSRDRITFSGTAAQLQSAFGAELHHYQVDDTVHLAPAADLTLPAPLAAITAAVLHLSDFRPLPAWQVNTRVTPNYTDSSTGAHYLLPPDLGVMYDFVPANIATNQSSITGTTQVAVVGQSYVNMGPDGPLYNFGIYSTSVGPYTNAIPILVPGSGVEAISLGDEAESEIDLEYINTAGASPGPFFVFVGDNRTYSVLDALSFVITEDLAPVVSISYGVCEPLMIATELNQWNALFEQAAAQGQTVVASAGDSGSTACARENAVTGITTAQQEAPAVSFPASNPYVTAVGGTQMTAGTFAAGNTQYWGPFAYSASPESLLSYVPEEAWNEGSAQNGILAGGGGSSSYYLRPPWQSSYPGMPAGTYRLLPDIALQSSVASPGFVFCTSDASLFAQEGQTSSCSNGLLGSNGRVTTAGGTSFAAPIFAGIVALLNTAQRGAGLGNINAQLYNLAAVPAAYASAFHDITSGTIACVAGAECNPVGQEGYAAKTGYDEATGLGSIDFNQLLAAWPPAATSSLAPTEVNISATPSNVAAGEAISLQITVGPYIEANAFPVPTGALSVAIDNTVANPSLAFSSSIAGLSSSYANFNLVAPAVPGYHLVTVSYPGDAAHTPATKTYPFLVGSVEATGNFSVTVADLTMPNNSTAATQVTVTPTGGFDGELMWSLAVTGGSGAPLTGCYAVQPLVVNNVSTETLAIGLGSACNSASPSYQGHFQAGSGRARAAAAPAQQFPDMPAKGICAGILLCGCLAARRRKWSVMLLATLAICISTASLLGCGGGGSSASGNSTGTNTSSGSKTTPIATYTMTLTGRDSVNGAIYSSASFTLTVN
jgi:subtilase family serine protease